MKFLKGVGFYILILLAGGILLEAIARSMIMASILLIVLALFILILRVKN